MFTAFPIVASLVVSFMNWPMLGERSWTGIENYARLFADPVFRTVTLNTALFVVLYVPLNLVVSLGLAAWLTPRIAGRHVFRVLFFIPTITPIVANVVVWRMLYQPVGRSTRRCSPRSACTRRTSSPTSTGRCSRSSR